jgi:hypothetical protein
VDRRYFVGFHPRGSRCASAICPEVNLETMRPRLSNKALGSTGASSRRSLSLASRPFKATGFRSGNADAFVA